MTDPTYEMHLPVYGPGTSMYGGGADNLWVMPLSRAFAYSLRNNDVVQCLYDEANDEWSWDVHIHRMYRRANGGIHVELNQVYIDPVDPLKEDLQRPHANHYSDLWWTEIDGDLNTNLRDTPGWRLLR